MDQLQFEQGAAFLGKRNRNIIVEVSEDLPAGDDYRWLTLGQVKKLLAIPNLVSMDTRTVISCIRLAEPTRSESTKMGHNGFGAPGSSDFAARALASLAEPGAAVADEEVLSWLTDLKCQHQLVVRHIGLKGVRGWHESEYEMAHEESRFFRVVAVDVEADSREVIRWSQPLVASVETGLIGFVTSQIEGVLHFLVQARAEPGSPDTVTVGPTVQCALGFECRSDAEGPFFDLVANPPPEGIRYSCVQSEEGGRFYRVENEYRLVEVNDGERLELPHNYLWLTLRQLQELLRFGLVNVEARSLLSCLSYT